MQRQVARDLLRDAARSLFSSRDYRSVSMEDVARMAGVSRTTLYAHFPSRGELLFSFLVDDLDEQIRVYRALSEMMPLDRDAVRAWLLSFRSLYDAHRHTIPLFAEAFRDQPELHARVHAHRKRAIAILGARYPAFDLETGTDPERAARQARANLMIVTIEQLATTFAVEPGSPDLEPALTLITDALLKFLTEGVIQI